MARPLIVGFASPEGKMRVVLLATLALLSLTLPGFSSDGAEPSLPDLLVLYKDLGLPLPPNDAPLVRYEVPGASSRNGGPFIRNKDGLGFLLKPSAKSEPPTLLIGDYTKQLDPIYKPKWSIVQPTLKEVDETDSDGGLLFAIQCQARGWDELAAKQFAKSWDGARGTAREQVLRSASDYWEGQLTKAASDRKEIVRRLKDLGRRDKAFDTQYHQKLIKSLELALIPGKGKPGSIEALIDDLVEYTGPRLSHVWYEREEHYKRLAVLGFEAVPALIEHLDDDRLTRGIMIGFNNFYPFNLRVRDIVSDLLKGLAGQEAKFDWLRRQTGYTVPKDGITAWWLKAQKEGEEAFLLRRFLDLDEPSDGARGARIREHRLLLLVAKYPNRIPEFYRTILEKNLDIETYALLDSKIPDAEKIEAYRIESVAAKSQALRPGL